MNSRLNANINNILLKTFANVPPDYFISCAIGSNNINLLVFALNKGYCVNHRIIFELIDSPLALHLNNFLRYPQISQFMDISLSGITPRQYAIKRHGPKINHVFLAHGLYSISEFKYAALKIQKNYRRYRDYSLYQLYKQKHHFYKQFLVCTMFTNAEFINKEKLHSVFKNGISCHGFEFSYRILNNKMKLVSDTPNDVVFCNKSLYKKGKTKFIKVDDNYCNKNLYINFKTNKGWYYIKNSVYHSS